MSFKKSRITPFLLYSALFLLCLGGSLWFNAVNRISLIYETDGILEHVTFLQYIRAHLLGFLRGENALFSFDFSLGLGMDAVANLNWFGLGDPFTLLTLLFPADAMEEAYVFILCLKLYCAGLFTLLFLRRLGAGKLPGVTAALIYCFSGSFLLIFTKHGIFAAGMLYLPLFLLGMERLLGDKSGFVLGLAAFLNAITGYYFLYANSLMLFVYALVRVLCKKEYRARFWRILLSAVASYCIGLLLSAPILLPALKAMLSSSRLGLQTLPRLRYSLSTYAKLLVNLVGCSGASSPDRILCMCAPCFFALLLSLFCRGKRERKLLLLIALIAAGSPVILFVLGGFSGNSNRWAYGVALPLAAAFALEFDNLTRLSAPQKRLLVLFSAAAAALALFLAFTASRGYLFSAAAVILTCGAVLLLNRLPLRTAEGLLSALALLTVCLSNSMSLPAIYETLPSVEAGQAQEFSADTSYAAAEGVTLTRCDVSDRESLPNSSALFGIWGTSVYNSTLSATLKNAARDWQISTHRIPFAVTGLDRRSALCALWSVDTFADGCGSSAPYGFTACESKESDVSLYRGETLPLGSIRGKIMSQSEYDALDPLDKPWALLQCAVLDDVETSFSYKSNSSLLPCEVSAENASFDGHRILTEEGGALEFRFSAPAGSEVYLCIENLCVQRGSGTVFTLWAESELGREYGFAQSQDYLYYNGDGDLMMNLGYAENGLTSCRLLLPAGEYTVDSLEIRCQDLSDFSIILDACSEGALTEFQQDARGDIRGFAEPDEDCVMVFSIPLSDGWTATVDGKDVPLTDSADTFLALQIPAGRHEISLKYETPGLRAGLALGTLGAVSAVIFLLARRKKRVAPLLT